MSLTLGIAIATSCIMSAQVWTYARIIYSHMLNATTGKTQSMPVMMDVLRISTYRRHFLRRRELDRGCRVWVSETSVHSAFVWVHNGDLFATASGTKISVSVSASGNANASLLMLEDCDSEHLLDSLE
jgi:hypothetical protein